MHAHRLKRLLGPWHRTRFEKKMVCASPARGDPLLAPDITHVCKPQEWATVGHGDIAAVGGLVAQLRALAQVSSFATSTESRPPSLPLQAAPSLTPSGRTLPHHSLPARC